MKSGILSHGCHQSPAWRLVTVPGHFIFHGPALRIHKLALLNRASATLLRGVDGANFGDGRLVVNILLAVTFLMTSSGLGTKVTVRANNMTPTNFGFY